MSSQRQIERPATLQINAWEGSLPNSDTLQARTPWAQKEQGRNATHWLAPLAPADERDWRHPDIGWGLVLPDDEALPPSDKAAGADAPAPIRKLLAARPGAPVLRWSPRLSQRYLRRYYADGKVQDLSIQAPKPGTGFGQVPRYLLIYASPATIPWSVQYALNLSTYVGRLDLESVELEHYVDALIGDWSGGRCRPRAPLVWSVDHGTNDITWLMERAVADRVWADFEADGDLSGRLRLRGAEATRENVAAAAKEIRPGLLVTTSHGMTGPLGDADALRAHLGAPVDCNHQALRLQDLEAWKPSGAIWYSGACCAAGSDEASRYADLFGPGSGVEQTLRGVAATAGAMVSPLPRALLGMEEPLRAFVGHVEPTFDWTLRDPLTREVLTHVVCKALYTYLYQQDRRTPVAYALREVFAQAGAFFASWQEAIVRINAAVPGMRDWALYRQLAAMDRQSLVILGDPTASLPLLAEAR
jgi:hypothetical protein